MAAAKGKKKMTVAEKKAKAAWKKEMQAKGVLPPDKKRLNRKAFGMEVMKAWRLDRGSWGYVIEAISIMAPFVEGQKLLRSVTAEQVGVLKVIKLAMDMEAFWKRKWAEGVKEASADEIYESVIRPVMEL